MSRALLSEEEAHEYVGGMPDRTFKVLFGDHAIRLGTRNYYRPRDLDEVVTGLVYGVQPEAGK